LIAFGTRIFPGFLSGSKAHSAGFLAGFAASATGNAATAVAVGAFLVHLTAALTSIAGLIIDFAGAAASSAVYRNNAAFETKGTELAALAVATDAGDLCRAAAYIAVLLIFNPSATFTGTAFTILSNYR
jgi:hypothetical protein